MRAQLRRFAAVGVLVTAVDFGVLSALRLGVGLPVIIADAVAILCSAVVSFFANSALTFTHDPHLRWVDQPFAYGMVTFAAGLVDIAVLRVGLLFNPDSVRVLLLAKTAALAVAGVVRVAGYRQVLFRRVRSVSVGPTPGRPAPEGTHRLSVVVPAYKASDFIGETVERLRVELGPAIDNDLEIIVVDDGSPDDTFAAAQQTDADLVLRLDENKGKGAAVRLGMRSANGRTIAFTDADLAYEPA
ncbi:MAG TPA: glycosyltransferase, partial [Acidimicrobiales bacterium]|nr:glycosyltransferase [Acidimicrobiales bacterium]